MMSQLESNNQSDRQCVGLLLILWLRQRMEQLYATRFIELIWDLEDECDGYRLD